MLTAGFLRRVPLLVLNARTRNRASAEFRFGNQHECVEFRFRVAAAEQKCRPPTSAGRSNVSVFGYLPIVPKRQSSESAKCSELQARPVSFEPGI